MQDVRNVAEGTSIVRNFEGPLKDTVLVPGRGITIIRFVADNPGAITNIFTLKKINDFSLIFRLLVVPLPHFRAYGPRNGVGLQSWNALRNGQTTDQLPQVWKFLLKTDVQI
jgi:Multicopper oxidase